MDLLFQRTARIIGEDGVNALKAATVAVFGTGGVGSYACEALGRAGVGHLIFIDKDVVDETNMNRQLVADLTTLGRNKAEIMAERVRRVNPSCDVQALVKRYDPSDDEFIPSLHADFIIDAIDDVPAKVAMAVCCWKHKIPEISSMGTGNRLHPEMLEIVDIYKTRECHLARKMRKALKEARVRHLPVVYSREPAHKIIGEGYQPGSISFVPPVSGMMMAGYVIREILKKKGIQ
ncbi:MAG: tRNA threonylcarbamoyladenosine dehydratase [Allisonella histaminiformans]|uniref:tRNA threonylcarbamoyladenosine dehydratase n=1 Tax=Allisonella histaminiformans TaxID=209880 RepID=UPI0023526111|nr:tRNA threonylcarbamoyladenosine dehydratase [Allisonella histaminiformans]MCI6003180.1 tRNA threonylcarbamoyladenosine dehydratase [Allisonella histaminiformans]MDY4540974.1 tRNA threonylcarbamoyladenosine dehydratase [Allisonella histaminiformans]